MILREHCIDGTTTPVVVAPLGDIQWSGDRRDLAFDHLQAHVAALVKQQALFIGMGDYIDFMSPSNRKAWESGRFYDNTRKAVEATATDLTNEVYEKILQPTNGRWLGLLQGHHWFDYKNGATSDTELCRLLDAPYLGTNGIVRLVFRDKAHTQEVLIWAHHGCGSSQFSHGPLLKLDRVARHWRCDIFLMGHQTKRAHGMYDFIEAVFPPKGSPRLVHRTVHLVGTGGWSKGYVEGQAEGTYVEQGMMSPVALGQPIIRIKPAWRTNKEGVRLWEPKIAVEA